MIAEVKPFFDASSNTISYIVRDPQSRHADGRHRRSPGDATPHPPDAAGPARRGPDRSGE